jgi:hypothetical protein
MAVRDQNPVQKDDNTYIMESLQMKMQNIKYAVSMERINDKCNIGWDPAEEPK